MKKQLEAEALVPRCAVELALPSKSCSQNCRTPILIPALPNVLCLVATHRRKSQLQKYNRETRLLNWKVQQSQAHLRCMHRIIMRLGAGSA